MTTGHPLRAPSGWPDSPRGIGTECRRELKPADRIRVAPKRGGRASSGSPCDRAEGSTPSPATTDLGYFSVFCPRVLA